MLGKQNHLKLTVNDSLFPKNLKKLYRITSKRQLEATPKVVYINLEMCLVDYGKLISHLK